MCDPMSLALATTAIGAVGTIGSSFAARSAQKKQEREITSWTQEQSRNRVAEQGRQEELRKGATAAQEAGLAQMTGQAQSARQAEEEARLTKYLQGEGEASNISGTTETAPTAEADKAMLAGQERADPNFKEDLAKKINESTTQAKQRIAALARVSSFGESFGGLGTTNPLLQAATGSAIDRQNEFRRGSLGAYNVERAVDPVQVTFQPSPLAGVFDAALSFGLSGLSSGALGKGATGGAGSTSLFPPAPKIAGVGADPWAGLRNTGAQPWYQF